LKNQRFRKEPVFSERCRAIVFLLGWLRGNALLSAW